MSRCSVLKISYFLFLDDNNEKNQSILPGYECCFCPKGNGQIRPLWKIHRHSGWNYIGYTLKGVSIVDSQSPQSSSIPNQSDDGLEDTNSDQHSSCHDQPSRFDTTANNLDQSSDCGETCNDEIADDDSLINKQSLQKPILRTLDTKVQYGWLHEAALKQLLSLFDLVKDDEVPYLNWNSLLKFV